MTSPVLGLMLPSAAAIDEDCPDPARLIAAARRAEAAGFDGVYVGDHLVHPRPLLESVVSLSVVAASTERLSIGPFVMLIALRQPIVLAKQLATVTRFAPGRLRLGVGVGGEYPVEFAAAGIDLRERGARTETALHQLRTLLSGRPVRVGAGKVATIGPAATGEVPVLFAGSKDVSLRRAAKYGDGWIGYLLSPDGFGRRRTFLLEQRAELGRPGELFTTGMLLPVHPDPDPSAARARAARAWSSRTANDVTFPEQLFVAGPPHQLVDQLHQYWEAGCTEMVLSLVEQGADYFDQLDLLANEILPRVREFR